MTKLDIKLGTGNHTSSNTDTHKLDQEVDTDSSEDEDDDEDEVAANVDDHQDMTHWFMSFDNRFVKPVFSRTKKRWSQLVGRRASPTGSGSSGEFQRETNRLFEPTIRRERGRTFGKRSEASLGDEIGGFLHSEYELK